MKTKTRMFTAAVAAFASMLAFSSSTFAYKPGCEAPPCGGSHDAGAPPDLGDLFVLYRDTDGLPVLVGNLCQQPLAAPGVTLPAIGDTLACIPASETASCVIPVDHETCAVVAGYETYTQEVDFGRTSVIRSPVSVLEASLEEAITKLATAQCLSLDPAGRLVITSEIDGEVVSAAIDSPLENLAIYRQLMLTGYLGSEANPIALPDPNVLNIAARGLGAASDKTGKVTVDQVVYLNQIMGLTDESVKTYLPKKCLNVREEVQGSVQAVRKCFLDYGPTGGNYGYLRADNFGALPAPAYIPESGPMDGWFEFLSLVPGTSDPFYFQILQGPIMDNVFGTDEGFTDGNIGGFAQAADDARAVIEFTHDRPLPLGYETAVPLCDAPDTDLIYDVSISEESGLQVPTRMVADAEEGRDIIVTVANAGPDVATGSVTVIGKDAAQVEVFNETKNFVIPGGETFSNGNDPWLFSLGYATTVSWTATAYAEDDLNTANNTVTATTTVKVTGRGGGQGGRQ